MSNMVMVRIKRMGKQWASCGVPVSPPEHLKDKPRIKKLCPKLVPGQVITVPSDHNLLNQEAVEVVRGVGKDEFRRPWVFRSADEAAMANPTKSRLGPDQIAMGLNMSAGAVVKGREKLEARAEARRQAEDAQPYRDDDEDDDDIYGAPDPSVRRGRPEFEEAAFDDDLPEDEDYVPTTQNRLSPDERDEIVRRDVELNPDDDVEAVPTRGKGRSRPATERAPRAPRKR